VVRERSAKPLYVSSILTRASSVSCNYVMLHRIGSWKATIPRSKELVPRELSSGDLRSRRSRRRRRRSTSQLGQELHESRLSRHSFLHWRGLNLLRLDGNRDHNSLFSHLLVPGFRFDKPLLRRGIAGQAPFRRCEHGHVEFTIHFSNRQRAERRFIATFPRLSPNTKAKLLHFPKGRTFVGARTTVDLSNLWPLQPFEAQDST
jgi:hypothetical protein